jgi:hypothetical protein
MALATWVRRCGQRFALKIMGGQIQASIQPEHLELEFHENVSGDNADTVLSHTIRS